MLSDVPPKTCKRHLKRVSLCVCVVVILVFFVHLVHSLSSHSTVGIISSTVHTVPVPITSKYVINNCKQQFTDRRKRDPEDYSKIKYMKQDARCMSQRSLDWWHGALTGNNATVHCYIMN